MQEFIERFFDQIINAGDHAGLPLFMTHDCQHQIALVPGLPRGSRGLEFFLMSLRDSFAQVYCEPQTIELQQDSFRVAFVLHGIHKGGFLNVETSGQEVNVEGSYSAQVYRGKITQDWLELNRKELLEQLRASRAALSFPKLNAARNHYDSYK
jgi:SnoaL-like polyketide cyclase